MNMRFQKEKEWSDMQARYLNVPYATDAELNKLSQAIGSHILPVAANSGREELLCAYILKKESELIVKTKPKSRKIKNPIAPNSLNSIQSVRSAQVTAQLSKFRGQKTLSDLYPDSEELCEFINKPFTKEELRKYYMSKGRYYGNNKKFKL